MTAATTLAHYAVAQIAAVCGLHTSMPQSTKHVIVFVGHTHSLEITPIEISGGITENDWITLRTRIIDGAERALRNLTSRNLDQQKRFIDAWVNQVVAYERDRVVKQERLDDEVVDELRELRHIDNNH